MLVSEAKKGVFVLEVEKDIRREGGGGGEGYLCRSKPDDMDLQLWLSAR